METPSPNTLQIKCLTVTYSSSQFTCLSLLELFWASQNLSPLIPSLSIHGTLLLPLFSNRCHHHSLLQKSTIALPLVSHNTYLAIFQPTKVQLIAFSVLPSEQPEEISIHVHGCIVLARSMSTRKELQSSEEKTLTEKMLP